MYNLLCISHQYFGFLVTISSILLIWFNFAFLDFTSNKIWVSIFFGISFVYLSHRRRNILSIEEIWSDVDAFFHYWSRKAIMVIDKLDLNGVNQPLSMWLHCHLHVDNIRLPAYDVSECRGALYALFTAIPSSSLLRSCWAFIGINVLRLDARLYRLIFINGLRLNNKLKTHFY